MKRIVAACLALLTAPAVIAASSTCELRSGATVPTVVELYTSEGCNSCPPADRWLSGLKGRADVIALAFHVDYWDRLGWTDRFASAAYTERQRQQQRGSGARFVYTPQVLVNGLDFRDWPGALPAPRRSVVELALRRDGAGVEATVAALSGAPERLAAYWTVLEDSHVSTVKAGENAGVTLHHDHVVRSYRSVPSWPAGTAAQRLRFEAAPAAAPNRRIALVVTDARHGWPLQALALGC